MANNQVASRANLLHKVKNWFGFGGSEGSWRGPFNGVGELGGSYVLDPFETGWNRNLTPAVDHMRIAIVYACVMMNARAVSQCTPFHLVQQADDGYEKSTTSPASRVLRNPNDYETFAQIITNTVAEMLFYGECLWIVIRDDRNAVTQVHRVPRHSWTLFIEPESNEIFYQINSTGDVFEKPDMLVPARNAAHFRQHCPRHPLIGESPLAAAGLAMGLQVALNRSQLAFFTNLDRPSGSLETDLPLNSDQVKELRARFNEQSKGWNQGGSPILTHGMKFRTVGVAQNDAQLVEQQKLSALDICRVFGVPYAMVGDNAGPQAGTEALITYWLSIGLGSVIESIERSLDRLFRLDGGERIELDPTPLLRVDMASRVDALGKAIQNGIMTPDEARMRERLSKIKGGDKAYLQRQMTAMDLLTDLNQAELDNKIAGEQPPPAPAVEPDPDPETDDEKHLEGDYTRTLLENRFLKAANE